MSYWLVLAGTFALGLILGAFSPLSWVQVVLVGGVLAICAWGIGVIFDGFGGLEGDASTAAIYLLFLLVVWTAGAACGSTSRRVVGRREQHISR